MLLVDVVRCVYVLLLTKCVAVVFVPVCGVWLLCVVVIVCCFSVVRVCFLLFVRCLLGVGWCLRVFAVAVYPFRVF